MALTRRQHQPYYDDWNEWGNFPTPERLFDQVGLVIFINKVSRWVCMNIFKEWCEIGLVSRHICLFEKLPNVFSSTRVEKTKLPSYSNIFIRRTIGRRTQIGASCFRWNHVYIAPLNTLFRLMSYLLRCCMMLVETVLLSNRLENLRDMLFSHIMAGRQSSSPNPCRKRF